MGFCFIGYEKKNEIHRRSQSWICAEFSRKLTNRNIDQTQSHYSFYFFCWIKGAALKHQKTTNTFKDFWGKSFFQHCYFLYYKKSPIEFCFFNNTWKGKHDSGSILASAASKTINMPTRVQKDSRTNGRQLEWHVCALVIVEF